VKENRLQSDYRSFAANLMSLYVDEDQKIWSNAGLLQ